MRTSLCITLGAILITALTADDDVPAIWETLDGCRLVQSSINDGDSFKARYGNEEYVFRLYWVDAPETTDTYIGRVREQGRYFSISEEDVIRTGKLSAQFSEQFLRGEFTVHTKWEDGRGGTQERFLAIVEKDGNYLSSELVANGLARIHGMPTTDKWPNGVTPRTYLGRLKNRERHAQREEKGIWALASGSMQMSGLEQLLAATESTESDALDVLIPEGQDVAREDLINVNTATADELDTLPGIGPALSQRIIAARPIETIDSLVEIPGISSNTLSGFNHLVVTEDPPPPPKTAVFYMEDLEKYINTEIVVLVEQVQKSDSASPESFHAVTLITANQGEAGGKITAFIPEEFYDSFLDFYSTPGKEFTGLLHQLENETVLVFRRQ